MDKPLLTYPAVLLGWLVLSLDDRVHNQPHRIPTVQNVALIARCDYHYDIALPS
jgi:hypothetical protein